MKRISLWVLMLVLLMTAGCIAALAEAQPQPAEVTPAEAQPQPAEATPAEAQPQPAEATPAEAQPTYQLRFVDGNGRELFPMQELHEGDPLELPEAKRKDHSFRGWVWYDAFGNKLERSETMPACDVTLVANWWRKEVKSGSSSSGGHPTLTTAPPTTPEETPTPVPDIPPLTEEPPR